PGLTDDNTGDDQYSGTPDNDSIYGGTGNDTLYGMDGNDVVLGEGGNDIVYGNGGDDELSGGEDGHDIVRGGARNHYIFESWNSDRLYGEDGDDTIVVRGTSSASGGNGNDTIHLGAFNAVIRALTVQQGSLSGGAGTDLLVIHGYVTFDSSFNAVGAGF